MLGCELGEELACRPSPSFIHVLRALTDALLNVEQALIGFGVPLAFPQLSHEGAGTAAEGGLRLDVPHDIKHEPAPDESTF